MLIQGWVAIVPLKQGKSSKSRLRAELEPSDREELAMAMAAQVIKCLANVQEIQSVYLLSPTPVPEWPAKWWKDEGRGLNIELADARERMGRLPLVIVHADLPCIVGDDVRELLAQAEIGGAAFAPDRHGQGTNAMALADDKDFDFSFGSESLFAHRQQRIEAMLVERDGLGFDVDTPHDLQRLKSLKIVI